MVLHSKTTVDQTYVAKQTIKKHHFHPFFRFKTHLKRFRFVLFVLYTGGGIAQVPIDMLEPIPSQGIRKKQQKTIWEMPTKRESSVATFSFHLSVISYFLCMIQTRRLNNWSWVVPQTYGMTTFVCWYFLPAKKQKIPKNIYLPLVAKPICIFREVREFRCIVSS